MNSKKNNKKTSMKSNTLQQQSDMNSLLEDCVTE